LPTTPIKIIGFGAEFTGEFAMIRIDVDSEEAGVGGLSEGIEHDRAVSVAAPVCILALLNPFNVGSGIKPRRIITGQNNKIEPSADVRREPGCFAETRWSQVLMAAEGSGEQAARAREELCTSYWPPIYSFLRRKGHSSHDAEDLTQQFFVRILGSDAFSRADRAKGRFRSFLLGSLKHFLTDDFRKATTQKRGAELSAAQVDFSGAEEIYEQQPDPRLTPEQVYDRHWADTLLDLAFQRLRNDFKTAQQLDRFEVLKSYLSEEAVSGAYTKHAGQLGMSVTALRAAVCRLRERYRQLLREVVADTLIDSEDLDQELHDLFG